MRIASLLCSAVVLLATSSPRAASAAAGEINVVVLRENGAGSASTAQTFVDTLIGQVAKVNGWTAAKGSYQTKRAGAQKFIETAKPHYGIVTLGAYLALRKSTGLTVVGQADVEGGGGAQYYVISRNQTDLAGCKGKTLATNHGGDAKFVDKVVAAGAFTLADFTVEATTRPVQTLKKVLSGESECALVDDAQMAELHRLEGGAAVHPVWFSAALPPMAVVSFASAPADEAKTFKAKLPQVCTGDGASVCAQAGLKALRGSDESAYAAVIKAYGS
jgi:hypothetical protein